jgi:hypothetical protein
MKKPRKPLARKTPLKPGKSAAVLRRSQIANRKPKYPPANLERARKTWEKGQDACWDCGSHYNCHTHHIASRAQAPNKFEHPCNWSWFCNKCHDPLNATTKENLIWALFLKLRNDRENFCFDTWQGIFGRVKFGLLDVLQNVRH